jgi:hypothetical protein
MHVEDAQRRLRRRRAERKQAEGCGKHDPA